MHNRNASVATLRALFAFGPECRSRSLRNQCSPSPESSPFEEKLADTLLKHLEGIANYCRTKVRMGVVEAVNGNIRMLINRGRGYKNLRYLLLKAKRLSASNLELLAVRRIMKAT